MNSATKFYNRLDELNFLLGSTNWAILRDNKVMFFKEDLPKFDEFCTVHHVKQWEIESVDLLGLGFMYSVKLQNA